jgi:hypothetical protein
VPPQALGYQAVAGRWAVGACVGVDGSRGSGCHARSERAAGDGCAQGAVECTNQGELSSSFFHVNDAARHPHTHTSPAASRRAIVPHVLLCPWPWPWPSIILCRIVRAHACGVINLFTQ